MYDDIRRQYSAGITGRAGMTARGVQANLTSAGTSDIAGVQASVANKLSAQTDANMAQGIANIGIQEKQDMENRRRYNEQMAMQKAQLREQRKARNQQAIGSLIGAVIGLAGGGVGSMILAGATNKIIGQMQNQKQPNYVNPAPTRLPSQGINTNMYGGW